MAFSKKLKVLLISEPGSGGVKRHILDLITNINLEKFEVGIIFSEKRVDGDYVKKLYSYKNVRIYKSKYLQRDISFKHDVLGFAEIIKVIIDFKPDVVHCHSSKAGALGRIAAKLCNVKKVFYTPHAYVFQDSSIGKLKKRIFVVIEKILSRLCTDKTINVSKGERNIAINENIDVLDKLIVINNGVNQKFINDLSLLIEFGIDSNVKLVGSIGRLDKQKNSLDFFRIAKLVICLNRNVKFVWIGNGEMLDEIVSFIKENNMDDYCYIIPFNDESEMLLGNFDVYVSTSLYEGYPYALLDANYNNIPIVASNVVGNNDVVIDGQNGFLYPVDDLSLAVNRIIDVIDGRLSYQQRELCNISQMVEKIEDLYMRDIL